MVGSDALILTIGFAAALCELSAFQAKKPKTMFLIFVAAVSMWTVHFALLEIWAIVMLNFVTITRLLMAAFDAPKKYILMLGVFLFVPISLEFWQGHIPLTTFFSTGGALMGLIGLMFKEQNGRLRGFFGLSSVSWLTHHILAGSIPGMLLEGGKLISNLIGFLRFRK